MIEKFRGRLLSGLSVERALTEQGPRVAAILGQRYQPLFENAEELFAQYMQVILAIMTQAREKLTEAVRRHAEELADDVAVRDFRDDSMAETRDAVFNVRDTCEGVFDVKKLPLEFPRRVSGNPRVLLEQVDHLIGQLSRSGLEMPVSKIKNTTILPDDLIETVKPPSDLLRKAVDDIDREAREAEVTLVEQDRAIEEWDLTFLWGARSAEGLFLLAGEDKLAARIRPSRSRPGRTEQDPEEPVGDEQPLPAVPPVPAAPPSP